MKCPHCQTEIVEQIRETSYNYETIEQLKKDQQTLTDSLALKDLEQKDLQAELRALNTLLSEEGINGYHSLQNQLDLVKSKLNHWTQLLTNHD